MKENFNFLFVECIFDNGKFNTVLHRMNVITGDYLPPVKLNNGMIPQLIELCDIVDIHRPNKIIFDKFGIGKTFYDNFIMISKMSYNNKFSVDAFGTIIYREDE